MRSVDDAFDQLTAAQELMSCCLRGIKVNKERMRSALDRNFAVATDFADALVREGGISFRDAHQAIGLAVRQLSGQPGGVLNGDTVLAHLRELGHEPATPAEAREIIGLPALAPAAG